MVEGKAAIKMENRTLLGLKNLISQFSQIDGEQLDIFTYFTNKITFKRNEYFSTVENPSASIAFVAKGLFRVYIIDKKGNEATLGFNCEYMPMSSYSAILLNQINPVYIQALEDSEIYTVTRMDLLNKFDINPKWKDILQKYTELDCLRLRMREISFLQDDAKTRYLHFLDEYRPFAERIKLRYVASYLGITSEALSRIRSSH
jgi:CRP-like cAMP-binding protein